MTKINKIFSTTDIKKLTKLSKQAQPKQKATVNAVNRLSNNVPTHYIR